MQINQQKTNPPKQITEKAHFVNNNNEKSLLVKHISIVLLNTCVNYLHFMGLCIMFAYCEMAKYKMWLIQVNVNKFWHGTTGFKIPTKWKRSSHSIVEAYFFSLCDKRVKNEPMTIFYIGNFTGKAEKKEHMPTTQRFMYSVKLTVLSMWRNFTSADIDRLLILYAFTWIGAYFVLTTVCMHVRVRFAHLPLMLIKTIVKNRVLVNHSLVFF